MTTQHEGNDWIEAIMLIALGVIGCTTLLLIIFCV